MMRVVVRPILFGVTIAGIPGLGIGRSLDNEPIDERISPCRPLVLGGLGKILASHHGQCRRHLCRVFRQRDGGFERRAHVGPRVVALSPALRRIKVAQQNAGSLCHELVVGFFAGRLQLCDQVQGHAVVLRFRGQIDGLKREVPPLWFGLVSRSEQLGGAEFGRGSRRRLGIGLGPMHQLRRVVGASKMVTSQVLCRHRPVALIFVSTCRFDQGRHGLFSLDHVPPEECWHQDQTDDACP